MLPYSRQSWRCRSHHQPGRMNPRPSCASHRPSPLRYCIGRMKRRPSRLNPCPRRVVPRPGRLQNRSGRLRPRLGRVNPVSDWVNPAAGRVENWSGRINPISGQMNPTYGCVNPGIGTTATCEEVTLFSRSQSGCVAVRPDSKQVGASSPTSEWFFIHRSGGMFPDGRTGETRCPTWTHCCAR